MAILKRISLVLCLSCVIGPAWAAPAALDLSAAGPAETVFRWRSDACAKDDIPDTPARAFRDAKGQVHLLVPHHTNRALVGPSLDGVRPDCRVVYKGAERDAPAAFDDRAWLAAPYTLDGNTVVALVHNEFQGHRRRALCPSGDYMKCWSNSVTAAVSHDGGARFHRTGGPVAAQPYRYRGDLGRHVGFFNPSNIVARDGFLYALVFAVGQGEQKGGTCLMRTDTLADPRSWRAWDGSGFTVRFADPYRDPEVEPGRHVCTPVGQGSLEAPVSSVVLHQPSGLYLATMAATRPEGGGVFVATSPDLIHWSQAKLALPLTVAGQQGCGEAAAFNYPSLIDPTSPTRNFETTGDRAMLYMTRFNLDSCKLGMDRDLIRVPVRISR